MPVSMTIVETSQHLKSKGAKTVPLTNAEQVVCEQLGENPSQVSGYVDLRNLAQGDAVVIRFYIKVKENGVWGLCYEESYSDSLSPPIVHVTKRPENHGLKVTIQQTTGSPKIIDYEFFVES